MKKYPIGSPVALIMQLDEHEKKHSGEPVTLILNGNTNIDYIASMGIYDVLRAYSQFMDLKIEVRFPLDFMSFAALNGLDNDRIYFSKSAFVIFNKPAIHIFGTATDIDISKKAFEGMLKRNYEVISSAVDKDTDDVEEWVCEGKLLDIEDFIDFGYKILDGE